MKINSFCVDVLTQPEKLACVDVAVYKSELIRIKLLSVYAFYPIMIKIL